MQKTYKVDLEVTLPPHEDGSAGHTFKTVELITCPIITKFDCVPESRREREAVQQFLVKMPSETKARALSSICVDSLSDYSDIIDK